MTTEDTFSREDSSFVHQRTAATQTARRGSWRLRRWACAIGLLLLVVTTTAAVPASAHARVFVSATFGVPVYPYAYTYPPPYPYPSIAYAPYPPYVAYRPVWVGGRWVSRRGPWRRPVPAWVGPRRW